MQPNSPSLVFIMQWQAIKVATKLKVKQGKHFPISTHLYKEMIFCRYDVTFENLQFFRDMSNKGYWMIFEIQYDNRQSKRFSASQSLFHTN